MYITHLAAKRDAALHNHVSGCRPVLRRIRVAEIADAGQTYGGQGYHNCLDTAALNHVPIVQPRAGIVWNTNDGIILKFIGPSLPFIDGKNAINDNSAAFVLQYKQFRMLFTGDDVLRSSPSDAIISSDTLHMQQLRRWSALSRKHIERMTTAR